jgi:Flp pilus assembly pilin Flp
LGVRIDILHFVELPINESGPERRVGLFETGLTVSYPGVILITRLSGAAERFLRDEEGVSIVEYAWLIGLITIVCMGAIRVLGSGIKGLFSASSTSI